MKKLALLLTAVLLLSCLAACSEQTETETTEADGETVQTVELAPLYGSQDDLLEYNPDRGWRLEAYVDAALTERPDEAVKTALDRYAKYHPQLCQVYFYLTSYRETETIPADAFARMQLAFDAAKERGIKLIVRFAYQSDMEGTGEVSDAIMLAHISQLQTLLEENLDTIHTVEAGFLGAWGEWHSYKQEHDRLTLLKAIMDMVPESLYVQVRYPGVKNVLADAEPDNPQLNRMGYHDDSFFGWQKAKWSASPGDEEWIQMQNESFRGPQGGEMFWGCQYYLDNWAPTTGALAILKFSPFHQNSFSLYHSFIEQPFTSWAVEGEGYYSIQDWVTEEITEQWLEVSNIVYDPLYFQDENGQPIARTAFEFISDHLGYRLRATTLTLTGGLSAGATVNATLLVENYGFSPVFNMESGFAILDANGNVVSSVAAAEPSRWLSEDCVPYKVAADLTLPEQSGSYRLAFYLKNSAGTGARLANDLEFIDGYTILQTIEIP